MVNYHIFYSRKAVKDIPKLKVAGLDLKAKNLIELLNEDPFKTPPSYEKLVGNLFGCYSRRINLQHRLVYQVDDVNKQIKIVSLWSHYEI